MKKFVAIFCIILAGIILAFSLNLFSDNQAKLGKKLEEVGQDFYENFYYDQISSSKTEEETTEFLERFEEVGIKVNLDNLSRFDEEKYPNLIDTFKNKKDNIECDIRNTRVIIYPKEPYTKTDYEINHELDCGFGE
ncbi:hypothetical protein [Globicatella sulfidifaciens]|uniref:Uncharacterized protein n=1 Tax=Globicatella sulfidifaciens TaxID=136093 RepID=A0A7X8GZB9_9LACT|nr:hypothetical protein [Globicatella sulfidifaciens]NLJ17503.1 hypothetical protein [Globicatella sulfidifaciens]